MFLGVQYLQNDPSQSLRQTIARFERLLIVERDPDVAKVYRAEIATAERMLDEIERGWRKR